MNSRTPSIEALAVAPKTKLSNYPEPFRSMMKGRTKRALGDHFGLINFGVNLTTLAPGSLSALRHAHSRQDEFIYVISGTLTLRTDEGDLELSPGMCAGFRAGSNDAHQLINRGASEAVYLEVGDRTSGDEAIYPDDDLQARMHEGQWIFTHKDGTPYP